MTINKIFLRKSKNTTYKLLLCSHVNNSLRFKRRINLCRMNRSEWIDLNGSFSTYFVKIVLVILNEL